MLPATLAPTTTASVTRAPMDVVNCFEIPVTDLARARAFYGKVLGKTLMDMQSPVPGMEMAAFPWEMGAPNSAGALVKAQGMVPRADATVVYFQCEDLANELSRVQAAGGKVLLPKTSIGQHGAIAHVLDSEGNRIGLHSQK